MNINKHDTKTNCGRKYFCSVIRDSPSSLINILIELILHKIDLKKDKDVNLVLMHSFHCLFGFGN